MGVEHIVGDLFDQQVDALVNPWNCNYMPRWWPSAGVSGQMKKRTGPDPWLHLKSQGYMSTGSAALTGAGLMTSCRYLIHVAGLHPWWSASENSIARGITAAADLAAAHNLTSVATPLVGAGTGGVAANVVEQILLNTLRGHPSVITGQVHWTVVTLPTS